MGSARVHAEISQVPIQPPVDSTGYQESTPREANLSLSQPEQNLPSVDRFFDSLTGEYTAVIERCFPRYREMMWALLDYLPEDPTVDQILDLGAGTGNLTVLLADRYPNATIHAVDVSSESLAVCQQRLSDAKLTTHNADMREVCFEDGQFDLVASSIAVHHLNSPEKRQLFADVYRWLAPGRCFTYADQHAGASRQIYERHIENWRTATISAGSTAKEWKMWMEHQSKHDHHDPLTAQIDWLRNAGFTSVDCPWRYLLWTVLQATKPLGDVRSG